jgi:hypothetical protein
MIQLFVVRIESGVDYQTCLKFYDVCARKNSAIVHFSTQSYAHFNPVLAAVQTAR